MVGCAKLSRKKGVLCCVRRPMTADWGAGESSEVSIKRRGISFIVIQLVSFPCTYIHGTMKLLVSVCYKLWSEVTIFIFYNLCAQ